MENVEGRERESIMPKYVELGLWIDKLRNHRMITHDEHRKCRELIVRRYIAAVYAARKKGS